MKTAAIILENLGAFVIFWGVLWLMWDKLSNAPAWLLGIGFAAFLIGGGLEKAYGHDSGQWEASDPKIRDWYQSLMQPDVPSASCCGEADAYFADEIHFRDGKTFAVVTDDRDDGPRGRPHVEVGTEIEIPPNKLKWDKSNPTGHGVVFISRGGYVFCYVQPGGV